MSKTIIWWARRDLRVADNTALFNARQDADIVVPVYILDRALLTADRLHGPRVTWLLDGLRALDADLAGIGGRLIVRTGKPEDMLIELAQQLDAQAVYFNRDYSPYAATRDRQVMDRLAAIGVAAHDFKDEVIHEAAETFSNSQQPYSVFGPYRRLWETLPKPSIVPVPDRLNTPTQIDSEPIPVPAAFGVTESIVPIVAAGESHAQARLSDFIADRIYGYADSRNFPAVDGTATISPYLRWGMLSIRTAFHAAREARERAPSASTRDNAETWIGELIWRDFYYQVLARNPHIVTGAYRPEYDAIRWQDNSGFLDAWQTGHTGFPIVDAAMRQMNTVGWMHNRCRMIVASFLCKDLLIDWRVGERYFMQRLLDGDLASNNGGWQWSAGTGTDAAPYFRIFNPTTQGKKFDPDGAYIRNWLPELAKVPDKFIHEPSSLPKAAQQAIHMVIGQDYPAPIVDHGEQRERVMALYSTRANGTLTRSDLQ